MFESEVFRKEIYCIEESTFEIVRTFRRSQQTFGASAVIRCPRRYAPVITSMQINPAIITSTVKLINEIT